jgi:hypothetical protein
MSNVVDAEDALSAPLNSAEAIYRANLDMKGFHQEVVGVVLLASGRPLSQRSRPSLMMLDNEAGPRTFVQTVFAISRNESRSAWIQRSDMTSHISKRKTGFRLPPDVAFEKQRLSSAWAYVFRHRVLGELGRILLQELDDGRCHISCEVVGDPSDQMTTQRTAIFKPLGLELARQMEAAFGTTSEDLGPVDSPARLPEAKEVIESKIIPCVRCGSVVAMLIFAPKATDPGRFEDYARKMNPQYNRLNVPTWIIGPALGEGPLIDRPADVLKVWPTREPIQRLPPAQFNPLLDRLVMRHCR